MTYVALDSCGAVDCDPPHGCPSEALSQLRCTSTKLSLPSAKHDVLRDHNVHITNGSFNMP
jgi:hypothetical protein